jgi:hypothetical protein
LLLFPLDFCRSFSWLVLIKPSPSEFGCGMPCLVLSMKASMMETQEEKDRFRKVSQSCLIFFLLLIASSFFFLMKAIYSLTL